MGKRKRVSFQESGDEKAERETFFLFLHLLLNAVPYGTKNPYPEGEGVPSCLLAPALSSSLQRRVILLLSPRPVGVYRGYG